MFFSQSYTGGHTPCCQSVARQVGCVACGLPGVSPLSGGSNACVARGDDNAPQGEYPEGDTPSGRFFGDFLIGEKVTRGAGRSARMVGAGAISSAKTPGAPSMARPCSRGAPAQSSPFVWDIQKRGQIFSIFHKNILPERVAFMQYKGNSKNAGNGAVFEL